MINFLDVLEEQFGIGGFEFDRDDLDGGMFAWFGDSGSTDVDEGDFVFFAEELNHLGHGCEQRGFDSSSGLGSGRQIKLR